MGGPILLLHHKLEPGLGVVTEGVDDRPVLVGAQPVLGEEVRDLGGLCNNGMEFFVRLDQTRSNACVLDGEKEKGSSLTCVGDGVDLVLLALELPVVVVGVALSGEVPDESASAPKFNLTSTETVCFR